MNGTDGSHEEILTTRMNLGNRICWRGFKTAVNSFSRESLVKKKPEPFTIWDAKDSGLPKKKPKMLL